MTKRWIGIFGITLAGLFAGCGGTPAPAPTPAPALPPAPAPQHDSSSPEAILGEWQGSSKCVNLELAPACQDETVVFDAKKSEKEGVIAIAGDKVVDGKRESMGGPLEFKYDANAGCWKCEFETPRIHGAWCLRVQGDDLTGSFDQIPGGAIREVVLKRMKG